MTLVSTGAASGQASEQELQILTGGGHDDEEDTDLENIEENGGTRLPPTTSITQTTRRRHYRHSRPLYVMEDDQVICPGATTTSNKTNSYRYHRRLSVILVTIVFTLLMGMLLGRAMLSAPNPSNHPYKAMHKVSQPAAQQHHHHHHHHHQQHQQQQQGDTTDLNMISASATPASAAGATATANTTTSTTATPLSLSSHDKNNDNHDTRVKFYMVAKTDRSGAAIKDMLLGHSYAFANNMIFGGACIDAVNWDIVRKQKLDNVQDLVLQERLPLRKKLTETLGLQDELPFDCPTDEDIKSGRATYLAHFTVRKPGFTAAWMEYLKSKTTFQYAMKDPTEPLQVVVHVRRGDVTPCSLAKTRYLPNIYYLQALDLFLPQFCPSGDRPCQITIYTERESYESHQPFIDRNYTLDYDSSIPDIWTAMVNADVLLMGMSSFSFVPAFLNRNTVIAAYQYRPYVHANAHNKIVWKDVPKDIFENALRVRDEFESKCENNLP